MRPRRPGGSTPTTSMLESSAPAQLRKTADPPPANGKQNSRNRTAARGSAVTSHVPAEEFPAIRKIYELYGPPGALENAHVDAPHNYNRESRAAVYKFFGRHVLGRDAKDTYEEKEIDAENLQDMLVFHGRSLPGGALTYDQLFEKWKEVGAASVSATGDQEMLRQTLRYTLGAEWPDPVKVKIEGQQILDFGALRNGERIAPHDVRKYLVADFG